MNPVWKIYRSWIIVKTYWVFDVLDVKTDNYFELHNVVLTASKFFRLPNMSLWNQKHRVKSWKCQLLIEKITYRKRKLFFIKSYA